MGIPDLLAALVLTFAAPAVELPEQPVAPPPQDLRTETANRRAALAEKIGRGVIWLEAAPPSNDRFFQEDNFYYLTGVEQPGVGLALRVGDQGEVLDEVLLLPAHNEMWEVWNGSRLTPGVEAEQATGVRRTAETASRQETLDAMLAGAGTLYVLATPGGVELPDDLMVDTEALRRELGALRLVKSEYEIHCLRNAIDITCASFHEALGQVRPDRWEFQVQAAMERGFRHRGSERPGFGTICGSGPNSCTLHYVTNHRQLQEGDLIVMDVGAKYRYYCADVTRTFPVSGVFSERQREVYDLVLAAQTAAAGAARPGMTMRELDAIAREVIVEGGFGPDRKYFKHGLGHWIGLNVHDAGGRVPIPVGSLFTIEPGIYIAEEGLGVRIEDDYIMTPDGAEKLSTGIPSDPDEIEALMRRRE